MIRKDWVSASGCLLPEKLSYLRSSVVVVERVELFRSSNIREVPVGTEKKVICNRGEIDFNHIISRSLALAFCALWLCISQVSAERLTLSAVDIGESWIYPGGAIELDASGPLRPAYIEKNTNPFASATVRGAGAALSTADRAFDGDPAPAGARLRAPPLRTGESR